MTWRDLINTGKPFVVNSVVYWVCEEKFYLSDLNFEYVTLQGDVSKLDLDFTAMGDVDWFENAKPHSVCMCPLSAFGIVHFDGCSRL